MQHHLTPLMVYAGFLSTVIIFLAVGSGSPILSARILSTKGTQYAAAFFSPSITVAEIQNTYRAGSANATAATREVLHPASKKVRILIVPGHQPDVGGTETKAVKERDIVVDIAGELADLLAKNPHYEVMVSRGKESWNPILQTYFDTHAADIEAFLLSQKVQMAKHLADGSIVPSDNQVSHNTTPLAAALKLFGVNKWASENNIDIVIHLHVNDYDRRIQIGKYSGFAVYVPDHQYSNAAASIALGHAIAVRLNAYHATSTAPKERVGVIEDQQLIATGSNNTVDSAALLIEYGYIYEPQFQNPSVRPLAVVDYAYQTYLGLQDFFNDPVLATAGSGAIPYDLSKVKVVQGASGPGIYALQSALRHLGVYPPAGKSFSDCPVSGKVGPCTISALSAYQKAQGLASTGALGPNTRAELEKDLSTL